MPHRLLIVALLSPLLSSQTFVVDAANGPGTNFTSLATAVATVPDGAVLLVRPGSYVGFTASGKGLAVLSNGGVVISDHIEIANTQPRQDWRLRGLQWNTATPSTGHALVSLNQCAGAVLLEDLVQPPWNGPPSFFGVNGIDAYACDRLMLRGCTIDCTATLRDCHTVIETSAIRGEGVRTTPNQASVLGSRTAVALNGGWLQVAGNSVIRGGDGSSSSPLFSGPDRPGIGMVNAADLRLLSGQVESGQGYVFPYTNLLAPAIQGSGIVRRTSRVTLQSSSATSIVATSETQLAMPELTGASSSAGGSLSATVTTENGDLTILVVGLMGPSVQAPGLRDPFWLDPNVHFFAAIGVQQPAGPIAANIAVPTGNAFRGLVLAWGAACQGPVTGFQASNPVVTLVH